MGTPPPSGPTPPPPKKSKIGLFIGIGCGCLLLFAIVVGIGIFVFIRSVGPGDTVAETEVQLNQPFTLNYQQGSDTQHEVWLQLDLSHPQGLNLTGPINISRAGQVIGQYNLELTGGGSPIRERSSSRQVGWVHTNSSTSGKTFLFPLPAYDSGETITLSGTVSAAQGTNARRLRLFVTD